MPDRDRYGDYLDGKLHGGGGATEEGAAGRAEYFQELEKSVANQTPFSASSKELLAKLLICFVVGRWAYHLSASTEAGYVAAATTFIVLLWRPLWLVVARVSAVFLLVCLVAVLAAIVGADSGFTQTLERIIMLIAGPVLQPGQ